MDSLGHQETGDDAASREPEYDSDVNMDDSIDTSFMKTPTKQPRERRAANAPLPNRQKTPVPHPDPDPSLPRTTTTRKRRVRHAMGTGRGTVLFSTTETLRSTERRVQTDFALLGSALRKVATAMEAATEALPEGDAKTVISELTRDTVARMSRLLERGGYSVTPNSVSPQLALPRQNGRDPFQSSAPAVAAADRHTAAQPTNHPVPAARPAKAAAKPRPDLRVLLRIDEQSPSRNKDPFTMRTLICEKLGLLPTDLIAAKHTKTGFSVTQSETGYSMNSGPSSPRLEVCPPISQPTGIRTSF
ncbi:hypothetical protein E4U27_000476 [Claviceps purpurea]|nr:hypothetical protein E4U27_000476 [Claviceps purpurea]